VFDNVSKPISEVETLVDHDVIGDGARLALGELRRQRGETVFDDES
jgi:lipopolysaccharide biosynthesis regulator YciM